MHIGDRTSYDQTQAWLSRSKASPLRIQVRLTSDQDWILALLVEHLHRWKWVDLDIKDMATIRNILLRLHRKSAPQLEHLHLVDLSPQGYLNGVMGERFKLFNNGSSTPRLQQVRLCGVGIDWMWYSFAGLTELEMTRTPHGGFRLPHVPIEFRADESL